MEYRQRAAAKARELGLPSRYISQHGTYDDCMGFIDRGVWPDKWGDTGKTASVKFCAASEVQGRNDGTMLKHFRMYPHDIFNDPRWLELEPRQQQQWLYLLLHMSRYMGTIPENYKAIARLLDLRSVKEAEKLIHRLITIGLLTRTAAGTKLFTISSTRLVRECKISLDQRAVYIERARKGGLGNNKHNNTPSQKDELQDGLVDELQD